MMPRRAEFDHSAVTYHATPATGDPHTGTGQWLHKVTASVGGQQVGFLDWNPVHGKVHMVHTDQSVRGSGIATGLWQHAHLAAERHGLVAPKHSDVQMPAGARWANSMTAKSGPKPLGQRRLSRKPTEDQESLF
jgi:GNAT superfamily N-acetyltransferase